MEIAWLILIGVTVIVILITSKLLKKKISDLRFTPVADSFFKLNSDERKLSLDLSWEIISVGKRTIPINSFYYRVLIAGCSIAAFLFFIGMTYIISEEVKYHPKSDSTITIYFVVLILMQIFIIFAMLNNSKLNIALQKELIRKRYYYDLQSLGVEMIKSNFSLWFEILITETKRLSVEENNLKPKGQYLLLSEGNIYQPNNLPNKIINVAYIFINGFITVVSDIQFFIKDISYSLVDSDTPKYIVTESNKWSTEEFHFQDIVEINYSVKPITKDGTFTEFENKQDGFLTLTLNNGSMKQYPTTKSHVNSFINIARERVRDIKMK